MEGGGLFACIWLMSAESTRRKWVTVVSCVERNDCVVWLGNARQSFHWIVFRAFFLTTWKYYLFVKVEFKLLIFKKTVFYYKYSFFLKKIKKWINKLILKLEKGRKPSTNLSNYLIYETTNPATIRLLIFLLMFF